ncbi:carbon-nitrogen hydrolase family protein [Spirosoma endbachense]|uniref:Carbon-nitrogen hydrolase family protein n=1 Tax=Spirosoma endbachense TaxID=2666025 RepID=A0A6P1W0G7_9BACT|nr:carbon-nitrogen hydrolase family protein [Spirosoma endbachense]QHV98921.1 carbon-nitrogen hydrolase family protein [Spirosoma endbachense]
MPTKVAVCQVPDIRQDVQTSLNWIESFTQQAEENAACLVCFPECFLQGYLTQQALAKKYALNLNSPFFKAILNRLATYRPAIVVGLIEEEENRIFNTAVVIRQGKLLGKYRKIHLLPGEQVFTAGHEYPVFDIDELRFGITICYDTQFTQPAAKLAGQGAKLILCPANNMMRYQTAETYKHIHHQVRMERVKENQVWLMSADVTGEYEGRIGYGPTSAINPAGVVVAQVPLLQTGIVFAEL